MLTTQPALKMGDGTTGYPEAVQLRLVSSLNSPHVKLVTTEDGSGLVLGGEKGHTQLLSRGTDPSIKIVTKDGREHTIKPRTSGVGPPGPEGRRQNGLLSTHSFRCDLPAWHLVFGKRPVTVRCGFAEH